MAKLCEYENCKNQAFYAFFFNKPTRCKQHKLDNQKIRYKKCVCGKTEPNYGLSTDERPSCCSICKTNDMIDLRHAKCLCGKQQPIYGYESDNKRVCCKDCKKENMIDLANNDKKCKCGKRASFGLVNDIKATCCVNCKTDEMIDINNKNKLCKCGTRAIFGLKDDIKPQFCIKCKTNDMIDLSHNLCICKKVRPSFGLTGDKTPTCCQSCKSSVMIDLCNKLCKSNYLEEGKSFDCATLANKKYKGYCTRCYSYHFPNDPLTFQIKSKTKEIAVRDYINLKFEDFYHDKALWIEGCDCTHKRRIDHRKLIGNTLLCIETDEEQHKRYDKDDEEVRYNDLMMIHGGKFIFIRFNPDKYQENGVNKNPIIANRLLVLETEIKKQIKRIENEENTELLEEIFMYYNS
jgi:hypothetical protein